MAKIDQATLERVILMEPTSLAILVSNYDADDTMTMQIDRTLQKLRRKKLIKMKRKGRIVEWHPVPKAAEAGGDTTATNQG